MIRRGGLRSGVLAVVLAVALIGYTTACRKLHAMPEDLGYVSDHAQSEQTFNDIQTIGDDAATMPSGSTLGFKTTNGGASITRSAGKIVVDFGPDNHSCHDGRRRRGKIQITYTGGYNDVGSVHTITFDNYYQNDNKVTGSKTVTNMGPDAQGHTYFNIHISGSVTLKGGGTITSVWDRVRTRTAGDNTADAADDVYEVTGTGRMTRSSGGTVDITIVKPLVITNDCHWVEAGTVNYALSSGASRTLDFGDAPICDNIALLTLTNGTVKTINLP